MARSHIELYLLRHADAGDPGRWTGSDDARPLSPKGERQAERLGSFLASVGFKPDAILTSPRVRAHRTAEIVAGHLDLEVVVEDRLAGPLDGIVAEAILRKAGDVARVVLVGHDPDLSELLTSLAGGAEIPMRKGSLARLDLERPIRPGAAVLRWLVPPDLLDPKR
jgi:phosphohistidine phosphatase